jgi:hypothetical protein
VDHFFESIVSGSETAGQALQNLAQSLAQSVTLMIIKLEALSLWQQITGIAGAGAAAVVGVRAAAEATAAEATAHEAAPHGAEGEARRAKRTVPPARSTRDKP